MNEELLFLLSSLREGKISVEELYVRINDLLSKDLLKSLPENRRGRVSEFINCLDSFDSNLPDCATNSARLEMAQKRSQGEFAYPRAQILEEAVSLENYLRNKEGTLKSMLHFFNIFR